LALEFQYRKLGGCAHGRCCSGNVDHAPISAGGYDRRLGWTGRKIDNAGLEDAPPPGPTEERASDDQAIGCWVDLDTHLADVEKAAADVVDVFDSESPYRNAIVSAAPYHDIGKSIGQWQRALPQPSLKDNVGKSAFFASHRTEAEGNTIADSHRRHPSSGGHSFPLDERRTAWAQNAKSTPATSTFI
jgi:hypothetical protein